MSVNYDFEYKGGHKLDFSKISKIRGNLILCIKAINATQDNPEISVLFLGFIQNAIATLTAFKTLLSERNYITPFALIRIQIDILLHVYAFHKSKEKREELASFLIKCKNKLATFGDDYRDLSLCKSLDKEIGFKRKIGTSLSNYYIQSCEFIHPSGRHSLILWNKTKDNLLLHSRGTVNVKKEELEGIVFAMSTVSQLIIEYVVKCCIKGEASRISTKKQ